MRAIALSICLLASAAAATPSFTSSPTATKAGDGVRIDFAVSEPTDVAVFIETADGKVVRHLVAGVLGDNPPPPLKAGSLAQSVEWDGKADYAEAAGAGPFRVRVALGTGAKFDKVLMDSRGGHGGIRGLAVGPDGTLYLLASFGAAVPNWSGERITALDRNGRYRRTVLPFPASLPRDRIAGYGILDLDGRPVPLVHAIPQRSFCAAETGRKAGMAVTADGAILRPVGGYRGRGAVRLSAIDSEGGAPWGAEAGPALTNLSRAYFSRPFVAVAADGKHAYVSGLHQVRMDKQGRGSPVPLAAVYRVKLPDRGPAEAFFGSPDEPGSDSSRLGGAPAGMAVDGQGNLLIADPANNRVVVVAEKDAKSVGSFEVDAPDHVAVDPAGGAVYITRLAGKGDVELLKLAGWKDPRVLARLTVRRDGDPTQPWMMALDASAKPAIVWMGGDYGRFLRIEDLGEKFGEPTEIGRAAFDNGAFVGMVVDHFRPDAEVYVRCGQGNWYRYNEATGRIANVKLDLPSAAGSTLEVGPEGNLYTLGWPYHLLRFTRDGKPLPWPESLVRYPKEAIGKEGKPTPIKPGPAHGLYVPVSMGYMTHTLGVRRDGHLFIFEPGHPGDRPPKMLCEYLPTGEKVDRDPIIWKVSDAAIGPKFDPAGNLYIAEQVKPVGQPYPPEFVPVVGELKLGPGNTRSEEAAGDRGEAATMYGSIVKFTPAGGMIHFGGEDPFRGEPKLDPSLKTVLAAGFFGNRLQPLKVTGAEWIRMGISHVDLFYCNCENTRFDVDAFGRVWYPDLGRFRGVVMDTNGNPIAQFGRYGNCDDVQDIALAWLVGVGATDRYVYLADSMNRRLLRAAITHAAEATCDVR